MLRPLVRLFGKLGTSFAAPVERRRLRTVLGVTPLEDRTVPAAIPLTGPNGGPWVKIDTLTVATRTNSTAALGVPSNVVLDAGVTYLAVASNTARIATDATGFTDAEYIRYNKSTGPQDGSSPGYAWNNHGVRLDGVDGGNTADNFWGEYQADHQYVREVTGRGTALRGWYSDIPGYYGDNSGTLQVDLYAEVPIVSISRLADAEEGTSAGGFRLTRTGDLNRPLTVTLDTPTGTATEGTDYEALPRQVTFPAGVAGVNVVVWATGDDAAEPTETVRVSVAAGSGYRVGTAAATVNITDTAPAVWIDLGPDAVGEYESDAILVRRVGDLSRSVSVDVRFEAVPGQSPAAWGADFLLDGASGVSSVGGMVTFAAGQDEAWLFLSVPENARDGGSAAVRVSLLGATGGYAIRPGADHLNVTLVFAAAPPDKADQPLDSKDVRVLTGLLNELAKNNDLSGQQFIEYTSLGNRLTQKGIAIDLKDKDQLPALQALARVTGDMLAKPLPQNSAPAVAKAFAEKALDQLAKIDSTAVEQASYAKLKDSLGEQKTLAQATRDFDAAVKGGTIGGVEAYRARQWVRWQYEFLSGKFPK